MIYCGLAANQWASFGAPIAIRKEWKHKKQDYNWISDRIIKTRIKILHRNSGSICASRRKRARQKNFTGNSNKVWTKSLKRKI